MQLTKISQYFNDKDFFDKINIKKVFIEVDLLINLFEKNEDNIEIQTQTEQLLIISIKNLINELVRNKKKDIIDDYIEVFGNSKKKEVVIKKWIKEEINILNENFNNNVFNDSDNNNDNDSFDEFIKNRIKENENEFYLKNNITNNNNNIYDNNINNNDTNNYIINIRTSLSKQNIQNENYNLNKNKDDNKIEYNKFIQENTNKINNFNKIQAKWKNVLSHTSKSRTPIKNKRNNN